MPTELSIEDKILSIIQDTVTIEFGEISNESIAAKEISILLLSEKLILLQSLYDNVLLGNPVQPFFLELIKQTTTQLNTIKNN